MQASIPRSCQRSGHLWQRMLVSGWFSCIRRGCPARAVCPLCCATVPHGAVSHPCGQHRVAWERAFVEGQAQ